MSVSFGGSVIVVSDVSDRDARLLGRAKSLDSLGNVINPSKEDGNLASILARLDVALSTRALEAGGNLAALTEALESIGTDTVLTKLKDVDMLTRHLLNSALFRAGLSTDNRSLMVSDSGTTAKGAYLTLGGEGPTTGRPALFSGNWQTIWEGPVDQRWRVIQQANVEYNECQRSKMTFA